MSNALASTSLSITSIMLFQRRNDFDVLPVQSTHNHLADLQRVDTVSSIASDATAPNLPGAGRTLGLFLDGAGALLENLLNKIATELGLGPAGVAKEIRHLRRHNETPFQSRLESAFASRPKSEVRSLRKLCRKLLAYARSVRLKRTCYGGLIYL